MSINPIFQTVNNFNPTYPALLVMTNLWGDELSIFYDNYVQLCNRIDKSPTKVAIEIGLNRSAPTSWKSGIIPRDATLQKIAKYFGTTINELMGEKNPVSKMDTISPEDQRLLSAYQQAGPELQAAVRRVLGLE